MGSACITIIQYSAHSFIFVKLLQYNSTGYSSIGFVNLLHYKPPRWNATRVEHDQSIKNG